MKFNRLLYRPDGLRISFSTHLFLFITLMFGIAFVLPPELFATGLSPLSSFSSGVGVGALWGVGLITVTVLNTIMLLTRIKALASVTGVLGFCLWLYAAFAYAHVGYWLGLLVIALPSVMFWAWYSLIVTQFRNSI